MLAGDVVALYYQGEKYSKVTGNIDYSRIYNNGKYSFIYVQAEKGQPEVLYYGGMKFAKIAQATSVTQDYTKIRRDISPDYIENETTMTVGASLLVQEVIWSRDIAKLENGQTYKTPWKVTKGNPNFSTYSYPEVFGYTKPTDEPAIYVSPDNLSSYKTFYKRTDDFTYITLRDGNYLKND